ncbi:14961_t:CDS:2 [Racocetra fulgida]|uniref:14961_t:CDS:1 n=1 Tax=Racocetra fulgida TaxID=60492 RepID=A0A9N8VVT4_9GLOM|nr:14961_t:CDS:2 [Racocetra fulgida]
MTYKEEQEQLKEPYQIMTQLLTKKEQGQLFAYLEIYQNWYADTGKLRQLPNGGRDDLDLEACCDLFNFSQSIYQQMGEIKGLKATKEELETKIEDLKLEITDKNNEWDRAKRFYNYLFELYEKATPENIEALTEEAKREVKKLEEDSESEEIISDFYQKIDKIMGFAREKGEVEEQLNKKEQELASLREELRVKTQAEEELVKELEQLKEEKGELEGKLGEAETSLIETRRELDRWKKELQDKERELNSLQEKLSGEQTKSGELERQLTALAVSSGLLNQQINELTSQLSEKEQEVEQKRLETEIRSNLVREQGEKISEQEQQINNYQQLLRTAESNLKKGQELLNKKEKQLEELEKEKNLIGEGLELASGRIKELESALVSANGKIARMEARIKDLESQGDNSDELERLKKELNQVKQQQASEKSKSQAEIRRLQSELAATKKREEELAEKIKELGARKVKVQEVVEKSFWETVKTPVFYGIDWAVERMSKEQQMPGSFPGQETPRLFTYLLSELTDATAELVFIPVNQPNFHWSLLVYETKTKTFYHYDTLGGAN